MTLTIDVRDFGPVYSAPITLKPLTIFVGPSNSGKSYVAELIYSLFGAGARRIQRAGYYRSRRRRYPSIFGLPNITMNRATVQEFAKFLESHRGSLEYSDLPDKIKDIIDSAYLRSMNRLAASVGATIERSIGTNIRDLLRQPNSSGRIRMTVGNEETGWNLSYASRGDRLGMSTAEIDLTNVSYSPRQVVVMRSAISALLEENESSDIVDTYDVSRLLMNPVFNIIDRDLARQSFYLPAPRSGVIQSYQVIAAALVNRATYGGLEPIPPMPTLPGVLADFIEALLTINSGAGRVHASGPAKIASDLEARVMRGRIDVTHSPARFPEFHYETPRVRIPLQRSSSMVSELAPVVLFLRYILEEGDLIVIEEPESHLHPATQRAIAESVVDLANTGVTVLITTHSDYFLEQVSNSVRRSALSDANRTSTSEYDMPMIDPADTAVYLFERKLKPDGTVVRELPFDPVAGIAQPEYEQVALELYSETMDLVEQLGFRDP